MLGKLTMTLGLAGSGKSTWAASQKDAVVITKDDIRAELFQKDWFYDKEKEVVRIRDFRISQALSKGLDVISADTNLAPKHEQALRAIAKRYKATFEIKSFLDVPIETCIARDKARDEGRVGEKVIRGMAEDFLDCSSLYTRTGEPQLFCDLDGVLADFDGFIERELGIVNNRENEDPDFWDKARAYPGRLYYDMAPLRGASELWRGLKPFKPIILTGCPWSISTAADDKRQWVVEHIDPDVLVIPCKSRNKRKWARPGDILIDDWTKWRHLWEDMGGVFIHYVNNNEKTLEEVKKALKA